MLKHFFKTIEKLVKNLTFVPTTSFVGRSQISILYFPPTQQPRPTSQQNPTKHFWKNNWPKREQSTSHQKSNQKFLKRKLGQKKENSTIPHRSYKITKNRETNQINHQQNLSQTTERHCISRPHKNCVIHLNPTKYSIRKKKIWDQLLTLHKCIFLRNA